jgi:metal-sulfur cluster biosynthetic enzyme
MIEPVPEHERAGPEWDALRAVIDPELGINIVDLGLVYGIEREAGTVRVHVTMTTPACPLTEMLESDIDAALKMIDGVTQADIDWVWDPPWDPSMMSDAARAVLNR